MAGTLPYMAPGSWRRKGRRAGTDIHLAGPVLYERLTGRRAFWVTRRPPDRAVLRKATAVAVPECSPELKKLIGEALAKNPRAATSRRRNWLGPNWKTGMRSGLLGEARPLAIRGRGARPEASW